ncbi:MAG: tetraacyldisaccharide 4'-kinase [Candidatus Rokubacteria bacterium]|nr:tetraacyldisaccharide 4'-kinase [Candidatus Rokubacteria bacterium]
MRWKEAWEGEMQPALAVGLSVLTVGYRGLLTLRQALYARGLLKSRRLPCPVISVGNLTLGGTGKTPAAELAVRTVLEAGVVPGIVSRGYGRRTRGTLVVADRYGVKADPVAAGDEPFLLARRLPGVPVVVGENRYAAGRACLELFGVGALVLDDAFQHRTLAKDLEIVLVSGAAPWGNGRIFPRGPLREPVSALTRAHIVLVTWPQEEASVRAIADTVKAQNPMGRVVTARYEPVECWEVSGGTCPGPGGLRDLRLFAFAGIARPANFARTLADLGVSVAGLAEFPDHHWFTASELEALASEARARGAQALITTEKDAVRCLGLAPPSLPLWAVAVRLVLAEGHSAWEMAFQSLLRHERH